MILDLGSYSVDRFIPFTAESYFRLFERQNATLWPFQFPFLALGIGAVVLAYRGNVRAASMILATAFATVAVTFHFRLYAELTPVGTIFGWVFLGQAGLLIAWALSTRNDSMARRGPSSVLGLALVLAGILHPLLTRLTQSAWAGADVFGSAPDPTVIVALGILLLAAKPRWLLVLFPLPLLWCAVSGATLHAIEAPFALALPILGVFALVGAIWKARSAAHLGHTPH